jgi:hypothetical protein
VKTLQGEDHLSLTKRKSGQISARARGEVRKMADQRMYGFWSKMRSLVKYGNPVGSLVWDYNM